MENFNFLKEEIKKIAPDDLLSRGVISLANDGKSFVCPFCGNGKGDEGDGLTPAFLNGVWLWHCFKCDAKFDNIKILADYYGLDNNREFIKILQRAADDFGFSNFSSDVMTTYAPKKSTAPNPPPTQPNDESEKKAFELVSNDIKIARTNLKKFIDNQGGSWRGLTFETLDKYNCGFIGDWTPPLSRANDKKRTPTPRVIIPAGNHYLARLTVPIQNFKNAFDFQSIKEKPHALPKHAFATDFITSDATKIFITEGEIDAMSLNQIYGGRYSAAIATLGAAVAKDIANEIFNRLDAVFADSKKPVIIILFDDDDAGRKNAPKLCEELIQRGYPAVVDFYHSDDGNKIDANSILVNQGADALRSLTNEIVRSNAKNLDKLRADIEIAQAKAAKRAEKQRLEDEKKQKQQRLQYIIFALPHADQDNATRIFEMYGEILRYNTETGNWGFFKNGVWSFPTSNNSALYPYTRKLADFIAQNRPKNKIVQNADGSASADPSQKPVSPEKVEIGEKLADKWRQAKTQRNAIELLKGVDEIHITQKDLDTHNNLLNVKNGVLDLETGILYPAAPELLLTKQANVIFNPRATCPTFDKFLLDILPDENTRAAVLRYLGYGLTGLVQEEKFLFVHGKGGNGKGTLFKTITYMLNNYATSFKIDTVLKQKFPKDGDAATPEIAKLCGARLAVAPEIPPGRELDTALLKSLTGGDNITARYLHSNSFIFVPTHKFVFEANDLPRPENVRDAAFLRRFLIVDFTEDFTGDKADPTLKLRLITEDELSGVLNLLLAESMEWYKATAAGKSGLIVSDAMQMTRKNYLSENDFIVNFINDFCVYNSQKSIPRKAFLDRLKKEYPQAYKFTNSKLVDMVCSVDGVLNVLDGHTRKNVFKGINWADDGQNEFNF
jgi:P4 family phage/plasmid primase-like protien